MGKRVRAVLEEMLEGHRKAGLRQPLYDLVLRKANFEGVGARPGPSPGEEGQCFRNCTLAILTEPGWEGWEYCEGYGLRYSIDWPVHHAWLARPSTGEVCDLTWGNPEGCEYLGLRFTQESLRRETLRSGYYGLFYSGEMLNLSLVKRLCPDLGRELEGLRLARVGRGGKGTERG